MKERTIQQALEHAEQLRSRPDWNGGEKFDEEYRDIVLLADEVKRLREAVSDLEVELGSAKAMITCEFS